MTPSRRPRGSDPELDEPDVRPVTARSEAVPAIAGWGPATGTPVDAAEPAPAPDIKKAKKPLYPRLLRLQHIHPNAWQRAALGEGAIGVGVLLSMADLASAWTILALPLAVAAIVKAHDALQGLLERGHDAAA